MKIPVLAVSALGFLSLAACSTAGNDIPGWFDLQYKLASFYEARAQERGATCNLPQMTVTSARIVNETPTQLVLDVGYSWNDTTYGAGNTIGGFTSGYCYGFSERQFVVSKNTDGSYTVEKMSGAQRS